MIPLARAFTLNVDGSVAALLEPNERELLIFLIEDIVELVHETVVEDAETSDAFEHLAAQFNAHPVTAPTDPAVHRLFPDAFSGDPKAAAEFRRFTEKQLRTQRAARCRLVLESLAAAQAEFRLTQDEAHEFVQVLTDLRLVLGTRLGITEDRDDDEATAAHGVYDWLTWLQEGLVQVLFMLPPSK